MNVTVDQELRSRLNGLDRPIEFNDESGKTLGVFLPAEEYYQLLYRDVEIPFSDEEIAQLRQAKEGCSLEEFWKRMGQT
jgi:hypothetical protein